LRLVVTRSLTLVAAGTVLGAALAAAFTHLLANLLYNVSPRDPRTFAAALAVMTIAGFAASFLPALRATQTDPSQALRD